MVPQYRTVMDGPKQQQEDSMAARKKTKNKAAKKAASRKIPAGKKPFVKKAGRGKGRPPFIPTEEQKIQVQTMKGMGFTDKEIAACVINPSTKKGISTANLVKFRPQLDRGLATVKAAVLGRLYKTAMSADHPGATTAAIFLAKTRYGHSERQIVEHVAGTGVLVSPAGVTPEEWVANAGKKNAGKKSPVE